MPIEFRCTQCGKLLRTGDDTAGRQAQCPECGTIRTVPTPAEMQPPVVPLLAPLESGGPPPLGSPFAGGAGVDPSYQSPGTEDYRKLAAERVSAPATALMVYAILSIVVDSLVVIGAILGMAFAAGAQVQADDQMIACGFWAVWGLVLLAMSIVVLIGARKMKNLNSYGFAMTGAILAMIPCFPLCWLIGLPFGIWALVVLGDNLVKAAFRN